eukprot:gene30461-35472_t
MLVDDYLHCLKQTASKSSPAAAPNPPKTPAAAPPNTPQTPPAAALNGQSQAAQNLSTAFPGGQSTDFHLRQLDATPGAAPKPTPQERAVQGFIQKLVPVHRELTISHARLIQLLATGKKKASSVNDVEEQVSILCTAGIQPLYCRYPPFDLQVSILLNLGMLARHPADTGSYLFCVPGMGVIVKSILAGRKELLSFIKRKKYKEIAEKQLLKTPQLRSSKLSMEYHLKDLLGRQTACHVQLARIKLPISFRQSAEDAMNDGGAETTRLSCSDLPVVSGVTCHLRNDKNGEEGEKGERGGSGGGGRAGGECLGIAEKQLLKTPQLRSSKLSMEYHLKDLLGRQTACHVQLARIKLPISFRQSAEDAMNDGGAETTRLSCSDLPVVSGVTCHLRNDKNGEEGEKGERGGVRGRRAGGRRVPRRMPWAMCVGVSAGDTGASLFSPASNRGCNRPTRATERVNLSGVPGRAPRRALLAGNGPAASASGGE